jgi:hypothetical protein
MLWVIFVIVHQFWPCQGDTSMTQHNDNRDKGIISNIQYNAAILLRVALYLLLCWMSWRQLNYFRHFTQSRNRLNIPETFPSYRFLPSGPWPSVPSRSHWCEGTPTWRTHIRCRPRMHQTDRYFSQFFKSQKSYNLATTKARYKISTDS